MRLRQVFTEANVAAKISKDPKMAKMLGIAFRHDNTLPHNKVAALGPKPSDQDIVKLWSDLLDDTLRGNHYGDLSAEGKFDDWLTRMYINGVADYEDINGEAGDALGAWYALSKRGKLKPQDQDFNKFKSIKQLQRIRNDRGYRDELERIKDAEHIEKMKREAKQIVIYDDERFNAIVPLNYGSCYSRDKSGGFIPSFCTSSSGGLTWFNRYAPEGIIINVIDKTNLEDKDGKWQMHAVTHQLRNATQDNRHNDSLNDEIFARLFPGLMKKLGAGLQAHAEEIKDASRDVTTGGYDIEKEIGLLQSKFPLSWNSKPENAPEEEPAEPEAQPDPEHEDIPEVPAGDEDPDTQPGTYRVTQIASGRTANIPGESLEDVQGKVLRRYPESSLEDYTFERVEE